MHCTVRISCDICRVISRYSRPWDIPVYPWAGQTFLFQTENPAGEINGLYKIQESRYLMKAKKFLSNVEIIPAFTVHVLHI